MSPDTSPDDLPPVPNDEATRTRREHDVYLKAVNNPVRRRVLELVSNEPTSVETLTKQLFTEELLRDKNALKFHLDILVKARCIEIVQKDAPRGAVLVQITQAGKVVDFMK